MKTCTICKQEKPLSEFNKHRNGLQSLCKECNKQRSREYYALNKAKQIQQILAAKNKRIKKNQALLREVLAVGCKCGFKDIRALEFNHLDRTTKKKDVSRLLADGYSWNVILEEISKCEVICANCHKIKTSDDFNWHKSTLN